VTTRRLIIECGVAETRAALIENDATLRFWFGPARGDEAEDVVPRAGRNFAGRVRTIDRSLNAAFVDIGDGLDAYLPLKKTNAPYITEGALIGVVVKSPPRQGKGAVLKHLKDIDIACDAPGRLAPFHDAAIEAVMAIGEGVGEIVIDDGRASAVVKSSSVKADISYEQHSVALFEVHDAQSALETAFDRYAPLTGGGNLVIDEVQALTAIDVDTGALSASSPSRLREKIAITAAYEAARQICLRNIGGHIVIDFPSVSDKAASARFKEELHKAMARIDGAGAFSFSKSGLFSFTAPHHAQSVQERFTDAAPAAPSPGRCFTLDWQAKSAIRSLEHRLRASPRGVLHLRLGLSLHDYMKARAIWFDRLRERYGARFDSVVDNKIEERGFELSEQ
jgi:Ribonuclease G/E